MRIRKSRDISEEKIEIQMTPMIDIVFQLLVFFIMTFKIVAQEGDFNIKMPRAEENTGIPEEVPLPPMKLRLTANAEGQLTGIIFNDELTFQSFADLHQHIRTEIIQDASGPMREQMEVELDCDYQLTYANVIAAVTAVSGFVDENDNVVKMIEKIKFAPPKNEL